MVQGYNDRISRERQSKTNQSPYTMATFSSLTSFSRRITSRTAMDIQPRRVLQNPFARSPPREAIDEERSVTITLNEWQGWGTHSAVPVVVERIIEDLRILESKVDSQMTFGGKGGKLQGDFKIVEDQKHRATYASLSDSEQKLQFFSARQIACRLLGSRGYLCQKCWLPSEDCMCSRITHCKLWHGMKFWLYMHPKDFLRQNNTGKLLWQLFGVQSATLSLFGIVEHEEMMWNAFQHAGKNKVWCLYPNNNTMVHSVQEAFDQDSSENINHMEHEINADETLNFVLIDGTWNNSAAMFRRLKDRAKSVWGEEEIPCISLSMGASAMHKLRPQPSWDRTCTAAAAIGLLSELRLLPKFSSLGLENPEEAIEDALIVLLDVLVGRRRRMGRSITRKMSRANDMF